MSKGNRGWGIRIRGRFFSISIFFTIFLWKIFFWKLCPKLIKDGKSEAEVSFSISIFLPFFYENFFLIFFWKICPKLIKDGKSESEVSFFQYLCLYHFFMKKNYRNFFFWKICPKVIEGGESESQGSFFNIPCFDEIGDATNPKPWNLKFELGFGWLGSDLILIWCLRFGICYLDLVI